MPEGDPPSGDDEYAYLLAKVPEALRNPGGFDPATTDARDAVFAICGVASFHGARGDFRGARTWFGHAAVVACHYMDKLLRKKPSWPRFVEQETPVVGWGLARRDIQEGLLALRLATPNAASHPAAPVLKEGLEWVTGMVDAFVEDFRERRVRSKSNFIGMSYDGLVTAVGALALEDAALLEQARAHLERLGAYHARFIKADAPALNLAQALLAGDAASFRRSCARAGPMFASHSRPFWEGFDERAAAPYLQGLMTSQTATAFSVQGVPPGLTPKAYFAPSGAGSRG